jgi:hypothetical protein
MSIRREACVLAVAALVVLSGAPAFAQGIPTSSISGTVVDSSGGIIPGASVVIANQAGVSVTATTNTQGVFSVPSLNPGVYTITVTLSGFKTAVLPDVRLSNQPLDVRVELSVGALTETVTVTSSAELVNTQTATVAATLNADQLNRMPSATRNALNAIVFLPGVNTPTTNRNSTINGLPESFLYISLDGVSNQDNFNKTTDGFFASVYPRQDAVEAVTVTSAASGVTQGGSGAMTISFVTRSGTNQYTGSAYEYYRNPSMNTNYWFNENAGLPKNQIRLHQFGGRFGGPIVLPGLVDGRNKAFFFFHYEELRFPNSFTRTRNTFANEVLDGWFPYTASDETRRVNVLQLAAANGQLSAVDPTVLRVLNNISSATETTGVRSATTNPLTDSYVWQSPGNLIEHQPTVRIDLNLSDNHRLSGSGQSLWATRDPDYLNGADSRYPGAPNFRIFRSTRPLYSISLRSTLSAGMVNELRGGFTGYGAGGSSFGRPDDPSIGPSFADQDGYAISLEGVNSINSTNWWVTNNPSWRQAPTINVDETLTWQKGSHSLTFGGSYVKSSAWVSNQQIVPQITLGFNSNNDPADFMFTSANFPGASSTQLTNARAVYAMLTGRVSSIGGQAALDPATNRYVAFGPRTNEGYVQTFSTYAQDSWRMTPTLTLNYGLRWDVQTPFTPVNDIMSAVTMESVCGMSGLGDGGLYSKCNFFSPGTDTGVVPEFIQYTSGTKGYDTDWNNVAPSVGIAWKPNVEGGWLRTLLGDPEWATLRAGYSVSYERQGLGVFTGAFGGNPGSLISLSRTAGIGNLVLDGESWPILLSQRDRLSPQTFNETPSYPIAVRAGRADDIDAFAPDIEIGSARTWTVGIQRGIGRDMAVELRYVGTRGVNQWSTLNYNSVDILSNGFYEEFLLAVQNLQANNAAGGSRAGSFAYFGPDSGTSPLPIYLAYLNGRTTATNPGSYTGSTWRSTSLTQDMVFVRPEPFNSANDLDGNGTRRNNALSAGLPANFFVVNPDIDDVDVRDSGAFSDYHALQVEWRRRMSQGLQVNLNYQYAREGGSAFLGFRYGRAMDPTPNVRHAFKTQWDWIIPVGRGERFGADMAPWLDALIGGWSFMGTGRVQARTLNFGNVRLVGMDAGELQSEYFYRITDDPLNPGRQIVKILPDDIILNTRRAFNLSPSDPTGYSDLGVPEGRYIAPANRADCIELRNGDCEPRTLLIRAPYFVRFDVGWTKRIPLRGRSNIEVRFDLLNLLDNINFNPVANPGAGGTIFQVNSAYTDSSNTYDPGGRLGQIMIRFNW